jgi:hypothetical protein
VSSFFVLGIYLLLLSVEGEGVWWICFLQDDSVEDEGDNGISNFLGMTTWRLVFSNVDIKVEMMSPL